MAILIGGIACLTLAFVVIGFTRRMAAAGYAYTYVSRSLGKRPGFLAGWLYALGLACFVPMIMAGVGFLLSDVLGLSGSWWLLFFVLGMGLLLALSVIEVHTTTRVQLVVGALTVLILLIVVVVVTVKSGERAFGGSVHLRQDRIRRVQRHLLRPDPGHHVLHRVRDGGGLR